MDSASKDYRDNMYGASYVSQFLRKKKKGEASKDEVTCGREGDTSCSAGRGEDRQGGDIKEGKTSSGSKGEANKVLTKKQAEKRAEEMEKFRQKEKEKHTKVAKSKF
jgi:hypothetical protein